MGHEHHFLSRLDRVATPHVEDALSLYRDHELLRFVLDGADLPDGAERVAISLEDPREGPFLIVTREGRFVTCLAKGMKVADLPVVARATLDGRIARATVHRERREERRRLLGEGGEARVLVKRLIDAGDDFSREEVATFGALQPVMFPMLLRLLASLVEDVTRTREVVMALFRRTARPRPAMHAPLVAHQKLFWALSHVTVLVAMGGVEVFENHPTLPPKMYTILSQSGVIGLQETALRGAWAVARLGKSMLPEMKELYEKPLTPLEVIEGVLALTALGFRHTKLRSEVRKALSTPGGTQSNEFTAYGKAIAKVAELAFDRTDECIDTQQLLGAEYLVGRTAHLPPGAPHRYERVEDVPRDLALAACVRYGDEVVSSSQNLLRAVLFLPWTARVSAEELFLPADVLAAIRLPWIPDDTHRLVSGWIDLDRKTHDLRRLQAQDKPVRKGPCPCGSGKKYKHCCEDKVPVPG